MYTYIRYSILIHILYRCFAFYFDSVPMLVDYTIHSAKTVTVVSGSRIHLLFSWRWSMTISVYSECIYTKSFKFSKSRVIYMYNVYIVYNLINLNHIYAINVYTKKIAENSSKMMSKIPNLVHIKCYCCCL